MNFLHDITQAFLPYAISVFEIIGVIVVCFSGGKGFFEYCKNNFTKEKIDIQIDLAKGLAVGLEFKMAAEILKTVLLQSMEEIYMLGAVILLRALLSLLVHFELTSYRKHNEKQTEKGKEKEENQGG